MPRRAAKLLPLLTLLRVMLVALALQLSGSAPALARVVDVVREEIAPHVQNGQRVLIAAHGNSLRALVKYLDNIPDAEIAGLNIPTGIPLVYELDEHLKPLRHYYLGDQAAIQQAMQKVANQGKAKG